MNYPLSKKRVFNKLLNMPIPESLSSILQEKILNESPKLINRSDYTLNDLFNTNNVDFVKFAYKILLRREADEDGLNFYCGKLAAGTPRIEIIYQISRSPESLKNNVKLKGLTPILNNYIKGFKTPVGIIYRTVHNIHGASIYQSDILATLNRLQDEITHLSSKVSQLEFSIIERSINSTSTHTEKIDESPISEIILPEMVLQDFRARTVFLDFKDLVV